ncbi:MAG: SH3 domain-containing protein [Pseudomonadota bacterium]
MTRDIEHESTGSLGAWSKYVRARMLVCCLFALGLGIAQPASAQQEQKQAAVKVGASGLQVPRFVSLKSNRVNVRKGPSTEHAVAWVFSRAGLPVEIVAEFEHWRQIRDSEGSEGWVFHALLSGRRTALVMPWTKEPQSISLHSRASDGSKTVAQLEPGVLGSVHECDGTWCSFTVGDYTGWIQQERLWGVYRGEELE